jgi:hypothetical protein
MNTDKTSLENESQPSCLGAVMPCFIRSLENLEGEDWMDCLGYDGIYSISNYGRIKSERRYDSAGRLIKEKILKQTISAKGIPSVKFSVNGVATTKEPLRLVGECFLGEKKDDEEYCHKNKNPLDNRLKNIIITKRSISKEICYKLGLQSDWGIGENSKKAKELRAKEFDIFEDGILKRRICSCCFKELDINLFYHTSKADLYRNDCKDCVKKHLGVIDVGKQIYRNELAKAGLRYCSCCKELKRLDSDFGKAKNKYMGKSNNCNACVKDKNATYRLKNKA